MCAILEKMNIKNSMKKLFSSYRSLWCGAAILLVCFWLDYTAFSIPNAPAILTMMVIYVAFQNGLIPALIYAAILWMYTIVHFSTPGYLFHYDQQNLIRVITFGFIYPANAFMVGVLKNKLTEKIHLEKIMREQVLLSARLSSLGEMASGIAHEINNPLTIIAVRCQNLIRLAQSDNISNVVLVKNLDDINQTVKRMSKIIKGLKTFARDASRDNMEVVFVNEVIESTLAFCQEKFSHADIDLKFDFHKSEKLLIECRPTEISQVLLNLLYNASDAIEGKDLKWIEIKVAQEKNFVKISVIDSGEGIPLSIKNKVMEPFFTTKEPGKGTGLGLSIALGISKAHGGNLYLDQHSKNTCFVLEIQRPTKVEVSSTPAG